MTYLFGILYPCISVALSCTPSCFFAALSVFRNNDSYLARLLLYHLWRHLRCAVYMANQKYSLPELPKSDWIAVKWNFRYRQIDK